MNRLGIGGIFSDMRKENKMKKLIQGIHHVAIRPTTQNYQRTISFYTEILGLEIINRWGTEEKPKCMISTGDNSCIEVLSGGKSDDLGEGAHSHLAFQTQSLEELVERVRSAGYEITTEPMEIVIEGAKPIPATIAFCKGPVSETIEFFQVK